ncbi:hypothetical protein NM208_g6581 [Fusarium decemcellulare]|uniref:Uncharacterized protein n=1 Tax=Fusarium decemcellulare TaxID=57161 RepID=A0ACC1SCH6_9HYPO|nr:hypothetical protein NM208_g6581 [Fusarium decemcellulare]
MEINFVGTPPTASTLQRLAVRDVTLKDGTSIPKGTKLEFATCSIHRDEGLYNKANEFEAFRFYRMRQEAKASGDGGKHHYVSVRKDMLGWGYGKSACPGRFLAEVEIKLILSFILASYDLKNPEGQERQKSFHFENQMGGLLLARVLFNDSKDIFSSSSGYSGDPSAIRSFTNGPFGMAKGIILSTGSLTSPLAPGDTCPSSYTTDMYDAYTATWCGADTYNGASFLLNVVATKATTLLVDMVIASCDLTSADKVLVLVNGVNYAKDESGTPLDSSSKYLTEPWGIPSPNGDTAFAMSSPPLRFSIPVPKTYVELKIAVCDRLDGYGDTAVMIKIRPCVECDQTFKVDYDTTSMVSTTTVIYVTCLVNLLRFCLISITSNIYIGYNIIGTDILQPDEQSVSRPF